MRHRVPSAVVMLDGPCSEVVWRVLATHCIRQFPLHFPSRASPCAINGSNAGYTMFWGSVKGTGYPLHSAVSLLLPLPCVTVCASAVVMLDGPCSEVVWRVLATHSIRQFPVHAPSGASPCAITFQLDSAATTLVCTEQGGNQLASNLV